MGRMPAQPKTLVNAVFEGGGVKGISLAGAVRAAELANVSFNRVAGTSSGSIVASLLAAGYSAPEMKLIIGSTPFSSFMKRAPIFNVKFIGPAIRLFLRKGLYSGDALEQWISELLRQRGIVTFGDLPEGKLSIVASDITHGKLIVLPDDIAGYGVDFRRFSVARAVRMSTSLPYFFDPVVLREPIARRSGKVRPSFTYIVDGGLLSNFPLWLFDQTSEGGTLAGAFVKPLPVIGFQMVGRSDNYPHRINGPISMFQAMFDTMLSAHDERYIESHNLVRTIKIPTLGVHTADFRLSQEKSECLYESGLAAGTKFFGQWDRKNGRIPG